MAKNLYLGKSQDQWDELSSAAEDHIIDAGLGQAIVGLYPAGDRVYGHRDKPINLFALYVDWPQNYLNPFHNMQRPFHEHTVEGVGTITLMDLHRWVTWVGRPRRSREPNPYEMEFLHVIPALSETQYEDPNVSGITYLVGDYLSKIGWDNPSTEGILTSTFEQALVIACYMRTRYILDKEQVFTPCLNTEWDRVQSMDLPPKIKRIDNAIVAHISEDAIVSLEQLHIYCNWFAQSLYQCKLSLAVEEATLLGKETQRYFATLL